MDSIDTIEAIAEESRRFLSMLSREYADMERGRKPEDIRAAIENYVRSHAEVYGSYNIFINLYYILGEILEKYSIVEGKQLDLLGDAISRALIDYAKSQIESIKRYCRGVDSELKILIIPPGRLLSSCIHGLKSDVYITLSRSTNGGASLFKEHGDKVIVIPDSHIQSIIAGGIDILLLQADEVYRQGIYAPPGSLAAALAAKDYGVRVIALSHGLSLRLITVAVIEAKLKEDIHVTMPWGEDISVYSRDVVDMELVDELVFGVGESIPISKRRVSSIRPLREVSKRHVNMIIDSIYKLLHYYENK